MASTKMDFLSKMKLFARRFGRHEFKSIKIKLTVIIIVMLIVYGAALTGIAFFMTTNNLKEAEIGKLYAVGDGTSEKLWLVANMGKEIATVLSVDPVIQSMLLHVRDGTLTQEEQFAVSEHLTSIIDAVSTTFDRVNVVDNQGIIIASSYPSNIGRDDSDRNVVSNQQRRAYIGEPYLGTEETPRIPYARPVYDDNGDQIGLVYITLNLPAIDRHMFTKSGLSDDSTNFLVGSDGTILSGVNGDYSSFLTKKFDLNIFSQGEKMLQAPGYYGNMEYIMKTSIPGTNWSVITSETVAAVNAPLMTLSMAMIVSSIIVILIGLLVAVIISNELTRPILALKKNAEQLALGDVDVAITHVGVDEIGQLADSFRHIIENMKQRVDSVIKLTSGDVNFEVIAASDRDVEGNTLIQMKETLSAMITSLETFTQQAAEGNLSYRADADQFQGVYRELFERLNQAFDLIINPLQEVMRLSISYSNGDYSDRFDPNIAVKGDFVPFKMALNQVGINSSDALLKIRDGVHEISTDASESASNIEDISNSVFTLAENSSHVSSLADQNDTGLEQALNAMEELAYTVGEVVQRTSAVYEIANQSSEHARDGVKRAELAGKGMQEILDSFAMISKSVSDMSEQIDEIGEIIEIITSIAEQTGLIALNAAIEAACAGDAGFGFAVVSDEVKALALETHNSADHIGSIIDNLQTMSLEMTDNMQKAAGVMQSGNSAVNETISIFHLMAESISGVNKNMSEVAAVSEEQAESVGAITASMSKVRDLVQDTVKEATGSAAAAEEISASLSHLKSSAVQSAQLAQSIKEQVGLFKID
jgi:methyl-accepting chemotaxis protein